MNHHLVPAAQPSVARVTAGALALAAAAFVLASVAMVVAATNGAGVLGTVVARGFATLTAVAAFTAVVARRWRPGGALLALGVLLGYAADPYTWSARGALASVLALPWPVTIVVDAVAWLAVGWLGRWLGGGRVRDPLR